MVHENNTKSIPNDLRIIFRHIFLNPIDATPTNESG